VGFLFRAASSGEVTPETAVSLKKKYILKLSKYSGKGGWRWKGVKKGLRLPNRYSTALQERY
jgi:hypothetical protein